MEPGATLDKLSRALDDAKERGLSMIEISSLEVFVQDLRASASVSLEHQKLEHLSKLAGYDAQVRYGVEEFKIAVEAGKEALNALLLISGGAVVALLGFAGAVISKVTPPMPLPRALMAAVASFGAAVLCGAIGFAWRYCSQAATASKRKRAGFRFAWLSIGTAVVGYLLFAWGLYGAYQAMESFPHP